MEVDEKIESNNKPDFSSIRGKKALISPSHEQFDLLKKLLEQRIIDSGGETIFEIGTGDNEENGIEPDEYAASVGYFIIFSYPGKNQCKKNPKNIETKFPFFQLQISIGGHISIAGSYTECRLC